MAVSGIEQIYRDLMTKEDEQYQAWVAQAQLKSDERVCT
jgi:hypothetical protein